MGLFIVLGFLAFMTYLRPIRTPSILALSLWCIQCKQESRSLHEGKSLSFVTCNNQNSGWSLRSGNCYATARVQFPVGTVYLSSFTSFARDSKWGVPSLNDLGVDGTLNTTNQPTIKIVYTTKVQRRNSKCFHR